MDYGNITPCQYQNIEYLKETAKRNGLEFCIDGNGKFALKINGGVVYASDDLRLIDLWVSAYGYGFTGGRYREQQEQKEKEKEGKPIKDGD